MMQAVNNTYLADLLEGRQVIDRGDTLNCLRASAVERVGALTVPSTRDEDWRFTDISPLTKISFQPYRGPAVIDEAAIALYRLPEATQRLVFVDGVFAPQLSAPLTGALVVSSLAAALPARAAAIEAALGRHALFENNAFSALNTAFLNDGALVLLPRGVRHETPVHLLFVATRKEAASHPRCLVVAGAGSEATVVEEYIALTEDAYLTNAVGEYVLADDAKLTHVRMQRESRQAFHIGHAAVSLAHGSHYHGISVGFGARLSRYNLDVTQNAEGASCEIGGLAVIDGSQLADTHSTIDHAMAHGVSRQQHKCIVGGSAHAVFNGRIVVRPGAQLTNSAQSSRNLLLSDRARVDTKPQLEIFADDVKCAHGATVGQLEAEEVFYLKSRGLSEGAARNLLTYAFGAEILRGIPVPSLRDRLEKMLLARMEQA
jgi:Fe-S cluster assembly protein SufD